MSSSSSVIWDYFTIDPNDEYESKVLCNVCDKLISRGGKDKRSFGLNGMRKHLTLHRKQNDEFLAKQKQRDLEKIEAQKKQDTRSSSSLTQTTLQESFVKIWDINTPSAQGLIHQIAEFISIDQQPLSVVEDEGFLRLLKYMQPKFKCPSRHYFTEKILPDIHSRVKRKIDSILENELYLSFTCDIWSSKANDSYCSLTSHYISENFERKEVVLACSHFPGEHSGLAVGEKVLSLLYDTNVFEKLHLIVRDSGSNFVAGFRDHGIPSVPCLAHIIQNVVNEGLLKGESPIGTMLNRARKLVGHFKHSPKATSKLQDMQEKLMPCNQRHQLIQSEPTRWNTNFYMLERLIEQKLPVMTVLSMNSETSKLNLREDQWELASHVIDLLRPFEIATRKLCAGSSCISQMIPFVQILNRGLEKALVESEFLRSARKQMIDGLESRTEKLFDNENCILATVLDPRFKLKLFDDALKIKAKVILTQLLNRENPGHLDDVSKESSAKRSKTDDEFDALMKEIIDNSGDENPSSASAELEIQSYLDEKTNSETDPLSFWKAKRVVYPQLSKFARKYLSAPATSVPSERLFSSTGNICSDKRSRLLPERLEMLVYLAKNLRILDFEY